MIDTLVILFSLSAVVFVCVRAAMLDRLLPWFSASPEPEPPEARGAVPARRPPAPAAPVRPRRRAPP